MYSRRDLMIALCGVSFICLIGVTLRMVRKPAPEIPSEPEPRELTMRAEIPLQGALAHVQAAALSSDGKYLAMCGDKNGSSGWVSLWNTTTGQALAAMPSH